MAYSDLKKEAFEAYLDGKDRNITLYSWPHASAFDRQKGFYAIKPSSVSVSDLKMRDMVVVDLDHQVVEGRLPVSDYKIHGTLYKNLPDIQGICLSHSPYATAWAQARRAIPVLGSTHAVHLPCDVPITEALTEQAVGPETDYDVELALSVIKLFSSSEIIVSGMPFGGIIPESAVIQTESALKPLEIPMVLIAAWGSCTWGVRAIDAVRRSQMLEEIAKIAFLTESLNTKAPRLDTKIVEQQFERKHANSNYYNT